MISLRLVEVYSDKSISFHTAPFSGSMCMASSSHLLLSAPQLPAKEISGQYDNEIVVYSFADDNCK